MITKINNLKNNVSKLSKSLMVGALMSLGFTANAQNCSASYTYTTSPAGVIDFTNTGTGTFSSYYWNFGNGMSSNQSNASTTYASNGSYNVCLTLMDSLAGTSCTFCDTVVVTNANAMGGCTALFTPFDSAGYGYFYNQSTAAGSITSTWDFGDGSTGTSLGDIVHQYAASGTYTACLTILDAANSCTDTYCTTITIGQGGGSTCNAYFSASTSGALATFTDLSTGSPMNYFWDFGDGSTSTTNGSATHSYSLNGTYYTCLTIGDTASGCSDTYCGYVTVGNPTGNNCSASFYLVQDSTNMYNYTAVSYASTGALYTYFWDFGDGSSSTQQYPTHTYAGVGPYVLCLTVTDNVGCTATQCDSLYAGRGSNVITLNVVQGNSTSVSEIELIGALENYPNPFNSSTTISYTLMENTNIELNIVDLLGKTIAVLENTSKQAGNHKIEFNADGVSEGMYLLQLKAGNNVSTKKLIINK